MSAPPEGSRLRQSLASFFNPRALLLALILSGIYEYVFVVDHIHSTCFPFFQCVLLLIYVVHDRVSLISAGLFWEYVHAHGRLNFSDEWILRTVYTVTFVSTLPISVIYAGVIYRLKDSTKAKRVVWTVLLLIQWLFLLLTLMGYANVLGADLQLHRPTSDRWFTTWLTFREHGISVFLAIGLVALFGLFRFRRWARFFYVLFICGILVFCLADRFVFSDPYEACYRFTDWVQLCFLMIFQLLTLVLSYTKGFKSNFQPTAHIDGAATTKA